MRDPCYLSPPQYAARIGCKPETIIAAILRGELVAINLARPGSSRPRYKISPEAIAEFERRRAVVTVPKQKRRRRSPDVIPQYV